VYVNGVRRRVQRGRRKTVRLRLPAGEHGAIRVRLVAITTTGRKVVDTRTYPACGAAAR
jgi:hypothetical protein